MQFSEKLDFIMNVTKTTNSALAHAVKLDASYISRLRRGKRLIPKDEGVIRCMAGYFARRCSGEYQNKLLSDVLKLSGDVGEFQRFWDDIARWLLEDLENSSGSVEHLLHGLPSWGGIESVGVSCKNDPPCLTTEMVSVYYGIEGKRRAVECFLSEVATSDTLQTLLLFSDEETSWMTEDSKFVQKWAALMAGVIQRGHKIKIIHTIKRDLDEMLNGITHWMPLYLSGCVEPYFYPKSRDGIFRTTLFIAPDVAAVVSGSVGDQIACAANLVFRDRTAIASYAEEFAQYLRLCRPLMNIFTVRDNSACFETILRFEQKPADTLIQTESLSQLTMPEQLLECILKRTELDTPRYLEMHRLRKQNFQRITEQNLFTEIITLPDTEALINGRIKVAMSALLAGGAVYYTLEEYSEHLRHVAELLETRENFRVHIVKKLMEDRYMIYVREELGAIVAKTSQPPVVLAMNESNMTAAFWDFLQNTIGDKAYTDLVRKTVVRSIRSYLKRLTDIQKRTGTR